MLGRSEVAKAGALATKNLSVTDGTRYIHSQGGHIFTSSCCPAWRESVQDECCRPLSELNDAVNKSQDAQDVDHIEFESDRLSDGVSGDRTCFGHSGVVQYFLSAGG